MSEDSFFKSLKRSVHPMEIKKVSVSNPNYKNDIVLCIYEL